MDLRLASMASYLMVAPIAGNPLVSTAVRLNPSAVRPRSATGFSRTGHRTSAFQPAIEPRIPRELQGQAVLQRRREPLVSRHTESSRKGSKRVVENLVAADGRAAGRTDELSLQRAHLVHAERREVDVRCAALPCQAL